MTSAAGDWYMAVGSEHHGPLDEPAIGAWIRDGRITATTLVWRSGMETWCEAAEVFPGVLSSATAQPPVVVSTDNSPAPNADFAATDRKGWVLALCVLTYLFAIETIATAIFLIYSGILTRNMGTGTTLTIASFATFCFAMLLFSAAIHMTRLVASLDRLSRNGSAKHAREVAVNDRRVWIAGVCLASALVMCQTAAFVLFMVGTARVS
ncbi:DUF4339 domain-containing protein [Stieleria sp. TO1_6]|nr:DUF4339 domain-containing protein [Stieleria tagensis]